MSAATKVVIQMNGRVPLTIDIPLSSIITFDCGICLANMRLCGAPIATLNVQKRQRHFSPIMKELYDPALSTKITMNIALVFRETICCGVAAHGEKLYPFRPKKNVPKIEKVPHPCCY